jgi:hypothetical protein
LEDFEKLYSLEKDGLLVNFELEAGRLKKERVAVTFRDRWALSWNFKERV